MNANERLILASASPRRRTLLAELLPEFDVEPSHYDEPEQPPSDISPYDWAAHLAEAKAEAVAARRPGRLVLGADTLVVCADRILGKASDLEQAREMLEWQARHVSEVVTGVCLLRTGDAAWRRVFIDRTRVWMRDDANAREAYLNSGDWQGKAGAYGIQTVGDRLVERIAGSFSNVVGLPLERLRETLCELDVLRGTDSGHAE